MLSRALRLAGAVPVALTLTLASCGGSSRHIGEITPEVEDRLSGTWVLNAEESDDPAEAMAAARPAEGQPGRGGRGGVAPGGGPTGRGGVPGAGGRGGMPGSGRAVPPRDGQGGGGRADNPEAQRATLRLMTVPPRHLEVSLSDSLVTLAYAASDVWVLPFGETVKRESDGGLSFEAKAEWENDRLIVRRSVSGGGAVTET